MNYPTAAVIAAALVSGVVTSTRAAEIAASELPQKVVVLRGAGVETVSFEQKPAASSQEVVVVRGTAVKRSRRPGVDRVRGDADLTAAWQAVAGSKIWLVDPERGRLVACHLRGAIHVGRRIIRCWARPLPD